jgi:hypothetical protein
MSTRTFFIHASSARYAGAQNLCGAIVAILRRFCDGTPEPFAYRRVTKARSKYRRRMTMLSKFLATTALGAALIAMPALAQSTMSPANPAPSAAPKTSPAPSAPFAAKKDDTSSSTSASQSASASGLWQGSKLVGLNVYNEQNDKIGSIVQLMVNKDGKIDSVVIGVGGFLGMGERDVAVKFSELKWSDQPVSSSSSSSTSPRPATTGAGSTSASGGPKTYPDHAVYSATKDQLKAMPQFDYNK